MVDQKEHQGTEGFQRRQFGGKPLLGCCKLCDFAAVHGFEKIVASWKVAVEGGVADAGSARDVVEARSCSIASENFSGNLKDALTVAGRVGARFAGGLGW